MTDKELKNLAIELGIDVTDLDKEAIIDQIIYIKEVEDEENFEMECTEEEKDESEFSFYSCVYKKEIGHKAFTEYLLTENLHGIFFNF